ncbi:N-6 DNA methylase [Roseomonas mucosa]|uniref:N-6 DNA methylase n=1 Tax=Roseomonas mucosa TaxID=207340 RepID=UPI001EF62DAC|nr:N-6 DNA methylase [Roseomonas mucosa]MCG7354130.1 N-6 DNA methylase [Roseomonas mucosa]MDT8292063.1 N-6 DNA methylase [Roseomonas mucosa]
MGIAVTTETDTVIKKVLPYLARRGYDISIDIDFEAPAKREERQSLGYVDLLVNLGKSAPTFLIEAKRASKKLSEKDKKQALSYGKSYKVPFVVVTNGLDIQCFNTNSGDMIRWDGKSAQKIPTKDQLKTVVAALKKDKNSAVVPLGTDHSLPFRPGLSPKQLQALFYRCHGDIRKIEKTEDRAFQDFSKILFLKLYEEKCDIDGTCPPYSFLFHELAAKPDHEADQVAIAIRSMLDDLVKKRGYGDVLSEKITLKHNRTYQSIVRRLAEVSFNDSSFDSKGAAFEYYVRATLKGKKLGQYFTPRPVIHLMSVLIGREKIASSVLTNAPVRVLDPACGTGGFLVYLMKQSLSYLQERRKAGKLTAASYESCTKTIFQNVFYGADANGSVASAAKMNMIIAGDGHSNIMLEDSLSDQAKSWSVKQPNADIVITNPPFGTSEADSLTAKDLDQFPIKTKKGQLLFVQKMVLCVKPTQGEVCTVIDEGVLNTDTATGIREWLLQQCEIRAIVRLPEVTFKPNKINVRSSIIYMVRRENPDVDLEASYNINFIDVQSLGYQGSGDPIRGFDEATLMQEIENFVHGAPTDTSKTSTYWRAFSVPAASITADKTKRLDLKYWDRDTLTTLVALETAKAPTLADLVTEPARRGKSPAAENYVDEKDGYAHVVKAGTNINKFGEVVPVGDFIEKNLFEEMDKAHLKDGDLLVSSTGDGTLGKCAVYRGERPSIADGHVTIVRLDKEKVYPEYVCDYLRFGFGALQIQRLFTGSTGLVELTADQLATVRIELPPDLDSQKAASREWRKIEQRYRGAISDAEKEFANSRAKFLSFGAKGPALTQAAEELSTETDAA